MIGAHVRFSDLSLFIIAPGIREGKGKNEGFDIAFCDIKFLGKLHSALRIDYLLNAVPNGLAKRNGLHLNCITNKK